MEGNNGFSVVFNLRSQIVGENVDAVVVKVNCSGSSVAVGFFDETRFGSDIDLEHFLDDGFVRVSSARVLDVNRSGNFVLLLFIGSEIFLGLPERDSDFVGIFQGHMVVILHRSTFFFPFAVFGKKGAVSGLYGHKNS